MSTDALAQQAMMAMNQGNPKEAHDLLQQVIAQDPERLDVRHALTVALLQLGQPVEALMASEEAYQLAVELADEAAGALIAQIVLTRASIFEDLARPAEAEEAYREVLKHEPDHPQAQQGLGYLLLAWGRRDEGVRALDALVANEGESPDVREGTLAFLTALRRFLSNDIHPKELIEAHRGSYVEFFDFHAAQMATKGWIAEAAKMRRDGDRIVPSIPPGARPYAAVRVDLVDPSTGQAGLVGDEPMLVGIEGYEALAHAPVIFPTPNDAPFTVWTSSQAPWDQLTVQVRFDGRADLRMYDAIIGDWYTAGFEGAFGTKEAGRFHYISDLEQIAEDAVVLQVDCGRAETRCVEDLLRKLTVLHSQRPIRHVVLGRGFLPLA